MKIQRREFLAGSIVGMGEVLLDSPLGAAEKRSPKYFNPYEIVPLGKTGIKVSRVGIGTGMRGWERQSDHTRMGKEKFEALLRTSYERGIRLFDLADLYGSHPYLIPALRKIPRKNYTIVSKIWFHRRGLPEKERPSPDVVVQRFLKELKTDYIDILLLHCVMSEKWPRELEDQMRVLEDLKKKGIIRAHGISCHSLPALEAATKVPWVDSVHARINPYATKMDAPPAKVVPVLQKLHKQGKGIIGIKIIGEGQFGKHPEKRDLSIDYVLNLGCVDTMVVGFEKINEIDDFAMRICKTPRRSSPPPLPIPDHAWHEDNSTLGLRIT